MKYVALGGTLCRTRFGRGYELVVGEFRPTAVSILVITYRGGLAPGERMRGSYDLRQLRWQGRHEIIASFGESVRHAKVLSVEEQRKIFAELNIKWREWEVSAPSCSCIRLYLIGQD